jgi:hypothetical protein
VFHIVLVVLIVEMEFVNQVKIHPFVQEIVPQQVLIVGMECVNQEKIVQVVQEIVIQAGVAMEHVIQMRDVIVLTV